MTTVRWDDDRTDGDQGLHAARIDRNLYESAKLVAETCWRPASQVKLYEVKLIGFDGPGGLLFFEAR